MVKLSLRLPILPDHRKPVLIKGYKEIPYVSGYNDGTFHPDNSLTRAEVAVMLGRVSEIEGIHGDSQFSDISMWAKEEINLLNELSVINGYSDGTFKPNKDINRGELAVLISKVLGLQTNIDKKEFTDI